MLQIKTRTHERNPGKRKWENTDLQRDLKIPSIIVKKEYKLWQLLLNIEKS